MTVNVYGHVTLDDKRTAMDRLGDPVDGFRMTPLRSVAAVIRPCESSAPGDVDVTRDTKLAVAAEAWYRSFCDEPRSPTTLQAYRGRLDQLIIPSLGNLRLRELKVGLIDRHLRTVKDKHGPGTAKMVRSVLSGIMGFAARHDAIASTPVRDAGRIRGRARRQATGADRGRGPNSPGSDWVTTHTFRKTVATWMDEAGLSARAAADQLGHAQPSMTRLMSGRQDDAGHYAPGHRTNCVGCIRKARSLGLVVDLGLTGLPNVVGIDTVRIVNPTAQGPTHLQESAACATT